MSEEEILAAESSGVASSSSANTEKLGREEEEILTEINTITMGAACASLGAMLGRDVEVGVPTIKEYDSIDAIPEPFTGEAKILVPVKFSQGLASKSAVVFRVDHAKIIANMVMGDPLDIKPGHMDEIQMSALSEAVGQMMGSAASSMASILAETVDVSVLSLEEYSVDALKGSVSGVPVLVIQHNLNLGGGHSADMIQVIATSQAREQVDKMLSAKPDQGYQAPQREEAPVPQPKASAGETMSQPMPQPKTPHVESNPVTVQQVQFAAFDNQPTVYGEQNKNLELVMDVTLNLTVELGKTEITIKEVLELTRGSVIELDRIAGEPVDLLANGKLIAKGEVVVIEDNFGLRITSIVSPADRIRGLMG